MGALGEGPRGSAAADDHAVLGRWMRRASVVGQRADDPLYRGSMVTYNSWGEVWIVTNKVWELVRKGVTMNLLSQTNHPDT